MEKTFKNTHNTAIIPWITIQQKYMEYYSTTYQEIVKNLWPAQREDNKNKWPAPGV